MVQQQAELCKPRDNDGMGHALDGLRSAAEGTENTRPYRMEAVHSYATTGEIIQAMKEVCGVCEEPTVLERQT